MRKWRKVKNWQDRKNLQEGTEKKYHNDKERTMNAKEFADRY